MDPKKVLIELLRRSKGEYLAFLQVENVVPDQIGNQPDSRHDQEKHKSGIITDYSGKRKNDRDPPDDIVRHHQEVQWVSKDLPRRRVPAGFLSYPCKPHVRMLLDNHSVDDSDYYQPDKA